MGFSVGTVDGVPSNPYTLPRFAPGRLVIKVGEQTPSATVAQSRQRLQRLLVAELLLILLISAGISLISGSASVAVLTGGLVYWVPRVVFAWPLVRRLGQERSERVFVRVLSGMIGKAVLMGVLIVLAAIRLPDPAIPEFFAAVAGFYLFGLVATVSTIAVP